MFRSFEDVEELDVTVMSEDEIVGVDRIDARLCDSIQAYYQEKGYTVVIDPVGP